MIHLLMCAERKFDGDLTSWEKLAYMCLDSRENPTLSARKFNSNLMKLCNIEYMKNYI